MKTHASVCVIGGGARGWRHRIMAARIPAPGPGLGLTPRLSAKRRLTGSYGAQAGHLRRLKQNLAGQVQVENMSDRRTGFQIAGPRARDLLVRCSDPDGARMRG